MTPSVPFAQIPADFRPQDVGDLMRVGRPYDGGYVVPRSALMAADHMISVGINDDWSFERASAGHKRQRALAATYLLTPVLFGAGERSRTLDLRITNALLYQLSYTGEKPRL